MPAVQPLGNVTCGESCWCVCCLAASSQARVSEHSFRDPGNSAWPEHLLELALLTITELSLFGLIPTDSLLIKEETWLADCLPESLAISRMLVSYSKPHEYQHPVEYFGKHQARAVIGWECHSATTWKVFSSDTLCQHLWNHVLRLWLVRILQARTAGGVLKGYISDLSFWHLIPSCLFCLSFLWRSQA